MAPTKTLGALLALLVVATGAAAAVPGNAPVDAPDQADNRTAEEQADDRADAKRDAGNASADGSEDRRAGPPEQAADDRGPPTDMPAPVPDFVSDIHQTIQQFLNGAVDDLGAAISDITPGGEDGQSGQSGETADGNRSAGGSADRPTDTPGGAPA